MSNRVDPLVSIIIPVYNGSDYLKEAIDSALSQTYSNFEVLVINDGSTDGGKTENIALSYGNRIRYFAKANGGVSSALNYGIKEMQGEFFSWLSHDDVYSQDKVKLQIEALSKYSDEDVIEICEVQCIDKDSKRISSIQKPRNLSKDRLNSWNEALKDLFDNGSFYGCALLIPKKAFEKCGEFREDLRYCQDYLMWLKLALSGYKFAYSDDVAVSLRIHANQLTQTGRSLYHSDIMELSKEIVPLLEKCSNKKENYLFSFAREMAKYDNSDVVRYCIDSMKKVRLFSAREWSVIRGVMVYGKIRPVIRKLYYHIFRGMKTS